MHGSKHGTSRKKKKLDMIFFANRIAIAKTFFLRVGQQPSYSPMGRTRTSAKHKGGEKGKYQDTAAQKSHSHEIFSLFFQMGKFVGLAASGAMLSRCTFSLSRSIFSAFVIRGFRVPAAAALAPPPAPRPPPRVPRVEPRPRPPPLPRLGGPSALFVGGPRSVR